MIRFLTAFIMVSAFALLGVSDVNAAVGGHCCGRCTPAVQCPCVPAQTSPPAAPADGQTRQSRSVEPGSAPPAAPQTGTTFRSYSYQPAPMYRVAPPRTQHRPYSPEQRLHPSNRLMGP